MDAAAEKKRLREWAKARRGMLSPEEKRQGNAAACRRVWGLAAYQKAKTVFCYVATGGEIDVTELFRQAWKDGKRVAVPKCGKTDRWMRAKLRPCRPFRQDGTVFWSQRRTHRSCRRRKSGWRSYPVWRAIGVGIDWAMAAGIMTAICRKSLACLLCSAGKACCWMKCPKSRSIAVWIG